MSLSFFIVLPFFTTFHSYICFETLDCIGPEPFPSSLSFEQDITTLDGVLDINVELSMNLRGKGRGVDHFHLGSPLLRSRP